MERTDRASLRIELTGGTLSFHEPDSPSTANSDDLNEETAWWGWFRISQYNALEFVYGEEVLSPEMEFRICASTDSTVIAKYKVGESRGRLQVTNDNPPIVGGILVIDPSLFQEMMQSIRSGRGTVRGGVPAVVEG